MSSINIRSRKSANIYRNSTLKAPAQRASLPINPDIIAYIQNVETIKDKDKEKEKSKDISKQSYQHKNSLPSQNQYERIINQKMKIKTQVKHTNFTEDMTYDKDKRFSAKKGLLYLLNKVSNGTFCPDIENYYKKMKETKMEEYKNKIRNDINNLTLGEDSDKKSRKKKGRDSSIKRLLNNLTEKSDNTENRINYNFKKSEKNKDMEELGIKKYEDDLDENDLIKLYDKKELKDNLFQINYNKEKLYKMKLKKENMKNNYNAKSNDNNNSNDK